MKKGTFDVQIPTYLWFIINYALLFINVYLITMVCVYYCRSMCYLNYNNSHATIIKNYRYYYTAHWCVSCVMCISVYCVGTFKYIIIRLLYDLYSLHPVRCSCCFGIFHDLQCYIVDFLQLFYVHSSAKSCNNVVKLFRNV